jgi:glutathione S-transferase
MLTLYDNAFSPFARKVRLVLDHKGLEYEAVDGLTPEGRSRLAKVSPRVEVPALVDGDVVVVNSADIVAYLEHRYPKKPVYPADPALRVKARAWERTADTLVDAIAHDVAVGGPGFPEGPPPPGVIEAARQDLEAVYADLEKALQGRDYLCGDLSIADLALFPHMTAVRFLNLSFDGTARPRLLAWYKRLRGLDVCRADLERARVWMEGFTANPPKVEHAVWRGDRIEWILAHGYHEWFFEQVRAGKVVFPRQVARG